MAIITVVGASGSSVQVTVDGSQQSSLVKYAQSVSDSLSSTVDTLDARNLEAGSTNFDGNKAGYGVITAPGAYQVSGSASWLTIGGVDSPLTGTVSVNAAQATSPLTVLGGTTGGINFQAGNQNGQFIAGTGNNTFNGNNVIGKAGDWTIRTGDGNDTINSGAGNNTIDAGGGNNYINLGAGWNVVHSNGQDTITGTVGHQSVTLNGASSLVQLGDNSLVTSNAPDGAENISVGSNSTVNGGNADTISLSGASGTVNGGTQGTISAGQGNFQVNQTQKANINVAGNLTFQSGTGDTTITAGQSTIFGAEGLNAQVDATSASSLFVAVTGNQTLNAASSVFGIHAFGSNSGTTSQVMIGGTGADTLVAGTGNATLTGGSGSANTFGFRNGIAGANYTITDFGSAAGNKVLLVHYNDAYSNDSSAFQKVLDDATHSTKNGVTSTTITLVDNTKITFDGVSSLSRSDFTGF